MQCPSAIDDETNIFFFPRTDGESGEITMSNPVEKNNGTDWKWLVTTTLAAIVVIGGSIWALHAEFGKLYDRLGDIDKHIARVETAVRIVGAKQGGDTKTLIDEALTVAKNAAEAGHTDNAKAILGFANKLLEEQRNAKTEMPPQFFSKALTQYQALKKSPELRESARAGTLTLAEYESAITPSTSTSPHVFHIGMLKQEGGITYLADTTIQKNDFVNSPEGIDIDYFVLDNVTFQNATIVYRGGPVIFRNVRFINCRFVVPDSPRGDQLLESVVKQPANTQIG